MIYHPISRYVESPELLEPLVTNIIGANRFYGIESNLDGEFFLLADDVTQFEKDTIDALEYPVKKLVKISRLMRSTVDPYEVPVDVDYVTGLKVKLHRKSIIVKGEIQAEEFYEFNTNGVFSNLIVKEQTTFTRDALGFPLYKDVLVTWYNEDGTPNSVTKSWRSYYSSLEQIKEGKTRRGNLVSNLQMPCIGLISIAMLGHTNATPEVILEGRRFLADYKNEFITFIDDSNKEILSCLNDPANNRYISVTNYSWIDSMTPYGVTIRQFITNEMTI